MRGRFGLNVWGFTPVGRAATCGASGRGSLHSWIDHLSGRIVKTCSKRCGHDKCRKCRLIHYQPPRIKHHKYLAVANFDCNAAKLFMQLSTPFVSAAARRSDSIAVTTPEDSLLRLQCAI